MTQSSSRLFRLTTENALYLLAFAIGVLARFLQLGSALLGDGEALAALQALELARGSAESMAGALAASPAGSQPFYTTFTALFFNMLKDSNALARLLPALAGSLLVFLPLALTQCFPALRRAGRWFGVVLAFALALDPGLVLLSRAAGSSLPGVFLTLLGLLGLALAFFAATRPEMKFGAVLAGTALGAALLSGPAVWVGLLTLVLALLLVRQVYPFSLSLEKERVAPLLVAVLATLAALVIAAPIFLGAPFDLSGLGGSLAGFALRLARPSGVPALRLLAALPVYHLLALIFGFVAVVRAWLPQKSPLSSEEDPEQTAVFPTRSWVIPARLLSLWAGVSMLVCLLMPGREMADLVWVLVPLWALAAIQLSSAIEDWLTAPLGPLLTASSVYVFLLMMLVLNLLNLNTLWPDLLARFQLPGALAQVSVIVAGIGLMLVIVSALFWLYWSPRLMSSALSLGATLLLLLALVGSTWSLSRLRPDSPAELWRASDSGFASPGLLSELYATLAQASIAETGLRPPSLGGGGRQTELEVVLVDPLSASPSLVWALRGFTLRTAAAVAPAESAGAVITSSSPEQPSTRLNTNYHGQDLVWRVTPAWTSALPPDPFTWFFDRQAPQNPQMLVMWVRGDLFPGGTTP